MDSTFNHEGLIKHMVEVELFLKGIKSKQR